MSADTDDFLRAFHAAALDLGPKWDGDEWEWCDICELARRMYRAGKLAAVEGEGVGPKQPRGAVAVEAMTGQGAVRDAAPSSTPASEPETGEDA